MAWILANGQIPNGAVVRHGCDNPPCCNPAHLEIGTAADNVRDSIVRGRARQPKGMENGHAKLTDEDVLAIRHSTERQREISARFSISQAVVSEIRTGKMWRHIGGPLLRHGQLHFNTKLTIDQVRSIKALLPTTSNREIARTIGCDPATVSRIRTGKQFAKI